MTPVELSEAVPFGSGLRRPECVKIGAGNGVFVSDQDHVLVALDTSGTPTPLVESAPEGFLSNGFSISGSGAFFIANLGEGGGLWTLNPDGSEFRPSDILFDGAPLPPANYVNLAPTDDEPEAMYLSISTRLSPRDEAFDKSIADGYLLYVDSRGARIVADGIGFTNENKLSPDGQWLYVTETIARRLSRYRVLAAGVLGERETVVDFPSEIWPDGFAFDEVGALWVASVLSNRLLRVQDGDVEVLLDESNNDVVERAEERFSAGSFDRTDFSSGSTSPLGNLASIAFGGHDRRTVYLGSLANDHLMYMRSSVAGSP